jgi:transmembrane sensor
MNKPLHIDPDKTDFKTMNTSEKIMWRSGLYGPPHILSKEEAFKKLKKKIASSADMDNKPTISLSGRIYKITSIAAAVVALIGSFWFLLAHFSVESVVVAKGQQIEYNLPDRTTISLNADSKITFNKTKFGKKRQVSLNGEAFFNVEKGSPFTISTPKAEIHILGTSFNVFARDNDFRVSCFTGKILVTSRDQSIAITPGETVYIDNNRLEMRRENNISSTAVWRVGEYTYENASLKSVFEEVERQFNVTFVLPDIKNKNYTGGFTNKNLVEALDIICIPMDLTYEIGSNGKILIRKKAR